MVKNKKRKVKIGDTVALNYTATLINGKIVSSTSNDKPAIYTLGKGTIHRALETKLVGMTEGESQNVTLPTSKAYGPYRNDLVFELDKSKFKGKDPKVGKYYRVKHAKGDNVKAKVTEINDSTIKLDGNHVLAGEDITFKIELVKIIN
jgi:peptidylprolyl isomerase